MKLRIYLLDRNTQWEIMRATEVQTETIDLEDINYKLIDLNSWAVYQFIVEKLREGKTLYLPKYLENDITVDDIIVDDTNDISNLVLLDEHTNRSYKNAVFPLKRSKIIERERKGTFVPIATKNVFMKFYTGNVSQMSFWGDNDRNSYRKDIIDKLNTYQSNNE